MFRSRAVYLCSAFLLLHCAAKEVPKTQVLDAQKSTLAVDRASGVAADGVDPVKVTLTLRDLNGAPLSGQTATLALSGTGSIVTQPGPSDANGAATATVTSTEIGTALITASVGSVTLAQTVSVEFVAGPAASLAFAAPPSSVVVGETLSPAVQVTLLDAKGRLAKTSTQSISLVLGDVAGATLSGTLLQTSVGGVATFPDLSINQSAAAATLVASAPGLTSVTSTPFQVKAGSPGSQTSLTTSASNLVADGVTTATLTVSANDSAGNPVAGQTVLFSASGTTNIFSTDGTCTTASNGSCSVTLASTVAETKEITATLLGTEIAKHLSITFVPGAPSALTSSLSAQVSSGPVGSPLVLTVLVADAQRNPIPNVAVALNANSFSPSGGLTDAKGMLTTTLTSSLAQTETVQAAIGNLVLSSSVTFSVGSPVQGSLTLVPSASTAPANSTVTLVVTVVDSFGNRVPKQLVQLSASGSPNAFTPGSGLTDELGVFTATVTSSLAQTETITAVAGGATATTQLTFAAQALSAAGSSLVVAPASQIADGSSTIAISLIARDQFGNPLTGQAVTLSATGANNTFTPSTGLIDATGRFTATLTSRKAQSETVSATVNGMALTSPVTFVPGALDAASSSLSALVTSATVGSSIALTVKARDAQGNPIKNAPLLLSADGVSNTLSSTTASTGSDGTFSFTLSSTVAQDETVSAIIVTAAGNATLSLPVTFEPGHPSALKSTLVKSSSMLTVGVAETLTLTVADEYGNPVPSVYAWFSNNGTGSTFSPSNGSTSSLGVLQTALFTTIAQTETVTATINDVQVTLNVTFAPSTLSSKFSSFSAASSSQTTDNGATIALTVTAKDQYGNPLAGRAVSLSASGSANTITPATGVIDASGQFTATIASTLAQTKTVSATADGVDVSHSLLVTFMQGAASTLTTSFAPSPSNVTADGASSINLVVTAKDAQSNTIHGQTVIFSGSGGSNTFLPAASCTTITGLCAVSLKSTVAQTETVTATLTGTGVSKTASVSFTPGAVSSTTTTFTASPTSLTANGTATALLTVTAKDAQGNAISGQAISLSASGKSNTFSVTNGITDSSGVFSATLKSTQSQTETITATIGAITKTASVTFTPTACASGVSLFGSRIGLGGSSSTGIVFSDFNGDGVKDMAVAVGSNNTMSLFLGRADGTFGAYTTISTQGSLSAGAPTGLAVADFNNDGKMDVVSANSGSANATVLFGNGDGTFIAPTVAYTTGTSPYGVVTGDFDKDGRTDFAITNSTASSISVYLNTGGSPYFTQASGSPYTVGSAPQQITAADFDGDGYLDLVTPNTTGSSVSVLLNKGSAAPGSFTPQTALKLVGSPSVSAAAAGDFDGDGKVDIAVVNSTSNVVSILQNTTVAVGTPAFTQASSFFAANGTGTGWIAVGDIDADGKADLVLAAKTSSTLSLLINSTSAGTINFKTAAQVTTGTTPWALALTDLNADGKLDVVASNNGTSTVSIALYSSGALISPVAPTTGSSPTEVVSADFNGDGKPDIATVNQNNVTVSVMLGAGNGSYPTATNYPTGLSPISLVAADFNNDGSPDLAISNNSSSSITILMNVGDGSGTFVAGNTVTVGVNPQGIAAADFNGDGKMDLVQTNSNSNYVTVQIGNGAGGFTQAGVNYPGVNSPQDVVVGDFNGDGKMDWAMLNANVRTIAVFLNVGGTPVAFAQAVGSPFTLTGSNTANFLTAADLNNDGYTDIIAPIPGSNAVQVLLARNNGSGILEAGVNYTVGVSPQQVVAADLNGDGSLDMAVTNGTSNTVSLLFGSPTGVFASAIHYATGPGPSGIVAVDLNGDVRPDLVITSKGGPFASSLLSSCQ